MACGSPASTVSSGPLTAATSTPEIPARRRRSTASAADSGTALIEPAGSSPIRLRAVRHQGERRRPGTAPRRGRRRRTRPGCIRPGWRAGRPRPAPGGRARTRPRTARAAGRRSGRGGGRAAAEQSAQPAGLLGAAGGEHLGERVVPAHAAAQDGAALVEHLAEDRLGRGRARRPCRGTARRCPAMRKADGPVGAAFVAAEHRARRAGPRRPRRWTRRPASGGARRPGVRSAACGRRRRGACRRRGPRGARPAAAVIASAAAAERADHTSSSGRGSSAVLRARAAPPPAPRARWCRRCRTRSRPPAAAVSASRGQARSRVTTSSWASPAASCGLGADRLQRRRDLAVAQREGRLDQAGDAGGPVEVAEVGLDRADQQRLARERPAAARPARRRRRARCRCRAPRCSRCRRASGRRSPAPRRSPRPGPARRAR